MSVLATIEPNTLRVEAGQETSLVVRIRNRGSIVDQFDIHIVGPTTGWAVVDPPSLRLFPDKEGEARVTFRPPRGPEPTADTYPFGVAVRAAADPTAATVEEGHIVVAPFVQLASQVAPQTSRGSMSGNHDLTVKNIGNAVAEVTITASDPDQLLNFEVMPSRVGLRAGGSATVRAKVKPKSTIFMGGSKRIPFQLQIDEPSAGSYQVPATLEQRPLIPGWTKVAFSMVVGALALVLVLPRVLGIPGPFDPKPTPTIAAVASPTPKPTPTPVITAPPPTAAPPTAAPTPTPTPTLGLPDTIVVAGEKGGLESSVVTLLCPPKNACRTRAGQRILAIIGNLQQPASGVNLLAFNTTPVGTLPVTATWKNWHYPYRAVGGQITGNLTAVAVDLGPSLVGQAAYAMIQVDGGPQQWFTVNARDAQGLLNDLYQYMPLEPLPTPAPDSGGTQVDYGLIYQQPISSICPSLSVCQIVK
jgi:hypothetical protein